MTYLRILPTPIENITGKIKWLHGIKKVIVTGKSELEKGKMCYLEVVIINDDEEVVYIPQIKTTLARFLWKHSRKKEEITIKTHKRKKKGGKRKVVVIKSYVRRKK